MTGVVYKSTGSWYHVKDAQGKLIPCRIKGKFRIEGLTSTNPVAVGDVVVDGFLVDGLKYAQDKFLA